MGTFNFLKDKKLDVPISRFLGWFVLPEASHPVLIAALAVLVAVAGVAAWKGSRTGGLPLDVVRSAASRPVKINLNAANWIQLTALPGIGDVRAKAIVQWRSRSGPFRSVEDLSRVRGIPRPTIERLKSLVEVLDEPKN